MRAKRYVIEFSFLEDTLTGQPVKWYAIERGSSRRRKKAVDNWWSIVSNNEDRKLYRLKDTKTGEVIV